MKNNGNLILVVLLIIISLPLSAQSLLEQKKNYTRADSLRGTLNEYRSCYDVTFYELNIMIDTIERTITGSNKISFNVEQDFNKMQIDLFENMSIINITMGGKDLRYQREFNAVFIEMPSKMEAGTTGEIEVHYHGKPIIAKRAPWDGGFSWSTDRDGNQWIAVSCEGVGASLWWPCKDYLGDEPDSMSIACTTPANLKCISNGSLLFDRRNDNGTRTARWFVHYPINNYNVTLNIGNYKHIHDEYEAIDGELLSLDYYVMPYNEAAARQQFTQVKPMLRCYEKFLGKYPFWDDGYALVETPYLGMEHQGAIAYGNMYKTGYAGMDFSRIGLDFDYIIIHETGHEWWGNSVSCKDIADMWIHEGFCTYSEAIYVECMHGYETALRYINAKKPTIDNKSPMVGVYGVNEEGDGDMYNKGMLFLNTLRYIINDDNEWWSMIKCMSDTTFKMRNLGYEDVEQFFSRKSKRNLSLIFEQYLKHADIPVFEYELKKVKGKDYELRYRWQADVKGFQMPVFISTGTNSSNQINGTQEWQTMPLTLKKPTDFVVNDRLSYIKVRGL